MTYRARTAERRNNPRGCQVENISRGIRSWDGWAPSDWINAGPQPPSGWYSVFHWIALTEPETFLSFSEPSLEVFRNEEDDANNLARREGVEPIE